MQVSIETTSGLERKLTVGVPAEQIENEVDARLQKAARTIRLDGFRRGKVPVKVVRQRFGAGVRQEVVGEIMNRSFYEAVTQEKVRPAGRPSIEPVRDEPGQDLEYVATFEVYPEVELGDFSGITVVRPVAEVQEADVEKMIDTLRRQQAKWVVVDRVAKDGDTVNIDYTGRKDGEEFEGGKAEGSDLVLGSGQMIPGFEDAIAGMSAGESKTVSLTFPEDYHSEDLKGADVAFDIKVNEVKEQELPELDDEFFAIYGVTEGGKDKFLEEVRGNMERELRNAVRNKVKTRVMDRLLEAHDVEVPKALVASEVAALKQQMISQFGGGQNIDSSMLPDDLFTEQAQKRVSLGLIVAKIVEQAEIEVDPERVRTQVEELASTYEQPEDVVQYYYSNRELLGSVESSVLEDQVVEYVLASAKVEEDATNYEDAIKPDPQQGEAASGQSE